MYKIFTSEVAMCKVIEMLYKILKDTYLLLNPIMNYQLMAIE